jgi:hypothetical protein
VWAESGLVNNFGLLASLVQSLAWPIAIVFVALLFREKLSTILDRVLEARYGKFTLKLRGADQLLKAAKRGLQPPTLEIGPSSERQISAPPAGKRQIVSREPLEPLAVEVKPEDPGPPDEAARNLDPGIRIELAWQKLARNVLAAARGTGLKRTRSLQAALSHLLAKQLVPSAFQDAFENVKATYKAIQMHPGAEVDEMLARDFVAACERLEAHLRQINY